MAPILRSGIALRCPRCKAAPLSECERKLECACGYTNQADAAGVFDLAFALQAQAARQRETYDQRLAGQNSNSDPWHCFTTFEGLKKTRALRKLRLNAGETFLEIGCASGPVLASLCANTGARGYGIDISPESVARQLARRGQASYDAICAPADELPFADASFDAVLSLDVLEHLAQPEVFMAEIARVLKPGGRALVKGNVSDIGLTFDWLQSKLRPAKWRASQTELGHFPEHFRSKAEHAKAARAAGLIVKHMFGSDVFWENIADYVILPRLYAPFMRKSGEAGPAGDAAVTLRVPIDMPHRLVRLMLRVGEWMLWPEWVLGRLGIGATAYFEFEKPV